MSRTIKNIDCNVTTKTLFNISSKAHPGLQICHPNARSLLKTKIDQLSCLFSECSVDIFCVTETFKTDFNDKL